MTDKELVAPRPLSESDISHLRTMFELQLHIRSQDDEEDASDLIDYALDMIGRGKNVGSIMEELEFMQYEVCNKTSAIKIGKCLSSFFGEISREMSGHPTNIDLSTKAASRKPSREMHQTLLSSGSISVKERSKMGIYNSKGELTKQWAGVITTEDCDFDARRKKVLQEHALKKKKEGERTLNLNLSAKDAAMKPYVEIEALDLDTSNREIRDLIYNEEGHLVAAWNNSSDVDYEDDSSEVNLSAQASAAKHHDEVDSLLTNFRHTKKGGTIEKNKIYSQDGQLNSWNKRIIEESSPKEMDLSTTGNLKKKAQELERLRSTGSQRRGIKSQIYSEDEQLNAWNKIKSKEEVIVTPPTTEEWAPAPIIGTTKGKGSTSSIIPLGEARRKEFESVMRDRKLSREERSRRIEEIKRKYAAQMPSSSSKATSSDGFSQEEDIHNQTKGEVKLSATDAASRQRNELDFLRKSMKRGSVLTANDQRSVMYNSRGELVGGYASNNIPREQMDHNLQMDLSTSGSIKKKDRELDMIRATGARRRNIQDKIYDSSGRLNAWNRWETTKDNVDVEVAEQSGLDMNLSAKGMEIKKAREIELLRSSMNDRTDKPQLYDTDGRIIVSASSSASNLDYDDDEQDSRQDCRYQQQMDLSAEGMRRKKSQEMELLRATANPRGLKQKMYNERGELVGSINNDGEQDRHNPDMDLSAEGMKLKKAREIEALRRAGRGLKDGAKKSMYDESGQLNVWNSKQKSGETAQMDLSTAGSIKKKDAELDAIRATGRQRRSIKDRIYDSNGQLNAWTSLKDDEDMNAEYKEEMDLSAEGMKLKKAREIEMLRSSMNSRTNKPQMYDADGSIVGSSNNDGEQNRHNQNMDLSAEGMKRKKRQEIDALGATSNPQGLKQEMYNSRGEIISARNNDGEKNSHNTHMDVTASGIMRKRTLEIQAIRTGSVDHKATVAPRKLTEEEESSLRIKLKSRLIIPNDSYEEDATDLLDYALDMIGDGKTVGDVTEELVFMEMDVLKADMADTFGHYLSTCLLGLGGDVTLARRSKTAMYDQNKSILDKKNDKCERMEEPRIDISTLTAVQKPTKEMQSALLSESVSTKERSQQGIYNSQGGLVNQWAGAEGTTSEPNQDVGSSYQSGVLAKKTPQASALDVQRRQEFQSLMKDRSLSREERALRIEEMKKKYSTLSNSAPEKDTQEDTQKDANLDLSALAFARKANAEMKALLLSSEKSAQERSKQEIYDSNGVLLKQWDSDSDEDEFAVHGINLSAQAAAKRAAMEVNFLLVKTKSGGGIQHRMSNYKQFVQPQGLYHHEGDDHDDARMEGLDLSAKTHAKKPTREVCATLSTGAERVKERSKHDNYDSSGVLIKQWANVEKEDIPDIDAYIDEQRKLYFQQLEDESIGGDGDAEKDQLLAEQRKYGQNDNDGRPEFRLSARSQARKPQAEIRALRAIANSEGAKKAIYDENGELIKQWANFNEDVSVNAANHVVGNGASTNRLVEKIPDNSALHEQRKQEFQAIMRDHTLGREERAQRIEQMKRKYSTLPSSSPNSRHVDISQEKYSEKDPELDLSALAFARKTNAEIKATLLSSPTSAKERSKQEIYNSNGVLTKQWANVNEGEGNDACDENVGGGSFFKSFMSKSLDEQRREELQLIMRDRSLTKDERAERIEEVKARYAAAAAGELPAQANQVSPKTASRNCLGKSDALDTQRRQELNAIMKNRSLDMDEKNRLMEEVKLKYDLIDADDLGVVTDSNISIEATQAEGVGNECNESIDATQIERKEIEQNISFEAIQVNEMETGRNGSLGANQVEGQGAESNNLNGAAEDEEKGAEIEDSIGAVEDEEKAMMSHSIEATQDGKGSEENGSPKGVHDFPPVDMIEETRNEGNGPRSDIQNEPFDLSAASFSQKHLKELEAIKAKIATGSSINDRMAVFNNDTTIYYDSVQFSSSQNQYKSDRQTAKRDAIQSASKYSYSYVDGSDANGTSAESKPPKQKGDVPTKSCRTIPSPTINCDPLAFAVKNNKAKAAQKAANRDTKESAKRYTYTYSDGGVVEETSAKFKAIGDDNKVAKKEAKESAKSLKYKLAPTIDCDPLAFAMKNNKSAAARKAVQRDTKESSKLYDYRYTG